VVDAEVAAHMARRAAAQASGAADDNDEDDEDDEDAADKESRRRSFAVAAGAVPAALSLARRGRGGDGHGSVRSVDGGGQGAPSSIQTTADFLARRRQRQQQQQGGAGAGGGEGSRGGTPLVDHAEGFAVADDINRDGDGGDGGEDDDGGEEEDDASGSGSDGDVATSYGEHYASGGGGSSYAAIGDADPQTAGPDRGGSNSRRPKPSPANPYGASAKPTRGGARGGGKKTTAKAPAAVKFPALPKGRISR
jgi:hypothetical protein